MILSSKFSFQYRQAVAALTHGDDDEGGSALGQALPDMLLQLEQQPVQRQHSSTIHQRRRHHLLQEGNLRHSLGKKQFPKDPQNANECQG